MSRYTDISGALTAWEMLELLNWMPWHRRETDAWGVATAWTG